VSLASPGAVKTRPTEVRRTIGLMLAVVATVVLVPTEVSADHGYWPAGGVDPATVTAHEASTSTNAEASAWGSGCESIGYGDGLDVYGTVLDADYRLAVVVAIRGGGSEEPSTGPHGVTIFTSPRAGEFVWADADGDGTFAGTHEADAGALFVCSVADPPPTDALPSSAAEPDLSGLRVRSTIGLLAVVLGLWWTVRRPRPRIPGDIG
jgi:hypothetical protein